MPTRLLTDAGHDITVFYSNSNIAPRGEYEKRLEELKRFGSEEGFAVIEDIYEPEEWERRAGAVGESLKAFSPALGAQTAQKAAGDADAYDGIGSVGDLLDDARRQERCRECYRQRLERAVSYAAQGGFEGVATTLAVSPYQFGEVIQEELEALCGKAGLIPHFEDYRPYYREATRISRELGMYRQNYCGCRFSVAEAEATRAFIKAQRKKAKKQKAQA